MTKNICIFAKSKSRMPPMYMRLSIDIRANMQPFHRAAFFLYPI